MGSHSSHSNSGYLEKLSYYSNVKGKVNMKACVIYEGTVDLDLSVKLIGKLTFTAEIIYHGKCHASLQQTPANGKLTKHCSQPNINLP